MADKVQQDAAERGKNEELERYRREKRDEGKAMQQPAQAARDPQWEDKDHLDIERDSKRPLRSGETKDAEGQAERDTIDQIITDDGSTETR